MGWEHYYYQMTEEQFTELIEGLKDGSVDNHYDFIRVREILELDCGKSGMMLMGCVEELADTMNAPELELVFHMAVWPDEPEEPRLGYLPPADVKNIVSTFSKVTESDFKKLMENVDDHELDVLKRVQDFFNQSAEKKTGIMCNQFG